MVWMILSNRGLQLIVGLLLCYLIANNSSLKENSVFSPSFKETVERKDEKVANGEDDEFHTIVVYRGPGNHFEKVLSDTTPEQIQLYSQVNQDKIVLELTREIQTCGKKKLDGHDLFFVDLAANDPIELSNTVRLEHEGWHGLCIEPNPKYWYRLAHRKCRIAGAVVGGTEDGNQVAVSLPFVDASLGGIVGKDFDNKPSDRIAVQTRFTVSLKSLFEKFEVPSVIDYLSLDVEGAEELVLQDFPFEHYTMRIMTVERPNLAVQALLKGNGYRFISMLVSFGETLWIHESVLEFLDISRVTAIVDSGRIEQKMAKRSYNMATARMDGLGWNYDNMSKHMPQTGLPAAK